MSWASGKRGRPIVMAATGSLDPAKVDGPLDRVAALLVEARRLLQAEIAQARGLGLDVTRLTAIDMALLATSQLVLAAKGAARIVNGPTGGR